MTAPAYFQTIDVVFVSWSHTLHQKQYADLNEAAYNVLSIAKSIGLAESRPMGEWGEEIYPEQIDKLPVHAAGLEATRVIIIRQGVNLLNESTQQGNNLWEA